MTCLSLQETGRTGLAVFGRSWYRQGCGSFASDRVRAETALFPLEDGEKDGETTSPSGGLGEGASGNPVTVKLEGGGPSIVGGDGVGEASGDFVSVSHTQPNRSLQSPWNPRMVTQHACACRAYLSH